MNVSRREFLRGTAVAGGAAVLGGGCAGMPSACAAPELGPIITDWEVRTHPTLTGKKASFFIDDTIWVLRDLTRQHPKSAFDIPLLGALRDLHVRYGLKLQLNLFYRTDYFYGTDEFTLADVTADYKAEFEAASDWLKFGLHALQEFPDYPFVNQEYEDLRFVADRTFAEVRRFAGENACALAFEPHWSPINKDGCRALRDCGIRLLSVTHGARYAYVSADQLPYGHGMRVENNRKPDTALFRRGYRTLDWSICGYNHLTWEQYDATTGRFAAVWDRDTRLLYKKFCNTIFLNQYKLDEIDGELARQLDKDHIVFADHEQYFYSDYMAYQADYVAKIARAARFVREHGYDFIFLEDTVPSAPPPVPDGVNTLTAAERAAGWQLLWDGHTGEGWVGVKDMTKFPDHGWTMEDGALTMHPTLAIKADGSREPLPEAQRKLGGGGDIVTTRTFRDFEFRFDFRLTKAGNSGVKYFYDETRDSKTCPEYQILDPRHPDAVNGIDGNRRVAALYDLVPAHADNLLRPLGCWNSGRIVVKGTHVEHWLNGVRVVTYERASAAFRAAVAASKYATWGKSLDGSPQPWGELSEGRIQLQDHADSIVSFCNLKVRVP